MKWLTRLEIDSDIARREKVFDSYAWHKKLWECFPGRPDDARDFMTRIDTLEGGFRAWILSAQKPVCPAWYAGEEFSIKQISSSFLSHRYYAFDLKANPVKAIVQYDENGQPLRQANGRRMRGKRVPLVNPDDLREWLVRKGHVRCRDQKTRQDVPGGFRLVESRPLEISPMSRDLSKIKRKDENGNYIGGYHKGCHGGVQFLGTLEVTDREAFIKTYREGIGSAKGFGFGLLLLAPINL